MRQCAVIVVFVGLMAASASAQPPSPSAARPDSVSRNGGITVTVNQEQQPTPERTDRSWYEFPFAVVTGVLVSLATIWLQSRHDRKVSERQEARQYATAARAACDELRLYEGKLRQLSGEFTAILQAFLKSNPQCVIPSYSVYPSFLEHSKLQLSRFFRDETLIRQLSQCHFELAHIRDRLEAAKAALRVSPTGVEANPDNLRGLIKLIDDGAELFKSTAQILEVDAARAIEI